MSEESQLHSQIDKKNRAVVFRITIAQFAVSLLITLVLLVLVSFEAAYSALLAGIISTFATIYVGGKFLFGKARTARERLASLYVAELIKILFVATAFCVIFIFINVHFLSFIGAYLATILVYWLAMVWPVFGVQVKQIIKQ